MNTTLNVPGISCDHCKSTIEGAVGQLEGIETVQVDIEQRTVAVVFDDAEVSLPPSSLLLLWAEPSKPGPRVEPARH